jgi:hypothetical protein
LKVGIVVVFEVVGKLRRSVGSTAQVSFWVDRTATWAN